jgi:prepilin signal peptidase PulO-like enzyme (type II secretory pathway)
MLPLPAIGLLDGVLGAAFGSLLFLGMERAWWLVRHEEALGMGDVKMMAMVGAFLGLRGTFLTILIGTFLGSVMGIALVFVLFAGGWKAKVAERARRRGLGTARRLKWAIARRYHLPLGTFLGVAALIVVFYFSSGMVGLLPRIR